MAVTAAQKAEFLEQLGKPKSLHYFMTGPNLGPDWQWSKALAGGYSQAEIDDFLGKGQAAYSAHKGKSKATPVDNGAAGPGPVVVGGACAKTAAKTVMEAASEIKISIQVGFENLWNLKNKSLLQADDVYDTLPALRKQLKAQIDEAAELMGDQAPEVVMARTMLQALESIEDMAVIRDLTDLPNSPTNLESLYAMRKHLAGRRLQFFQNQNSINAALNEVSSHAGNDLASLLAQWGDDVDVLVTSRFYLQLIQNPNALDVLEQLSKTSAQALVLPGQGVKALADLNDLVAEWLNSTNGVFHSLDELAGLTTVEQIKTSAALVSSKVSQALGDSVDVDWWKGGFTLTDEAPIKSYPDFDAFSIELATMEDVLATGNELGVGVVKKQFSAQTMSNSFDAHAAAKADLLEELPIPAAEITDEVLLTPVEQLLAQAGTDDLNPMTKKLLESQNETPSLTYFMSKQQKIDYLSDPEFAQKVYTIKYKGEEITGPGLFTAKTKYAMKNGSPAPKASAHLEAGATSIDEALAASVKTPPVNAGGVVPITGEPVALPPGAPKWWAHPPTDKQASFLDDLIDKLGEQGGVVELVDGGWYDAHKAGTLTKGHYSLMIDKVKTAIDEVQNVSLTDVDNVLHYGQTKAAKDALDAAFDAIDATTGSVNPVADVVDQLVDGPMVSGQKAATAVMPDNPVWDAPHDFAYQGDGQVKWGGAHRKWWFTDEEGNDWMLKHGADFRAEGELAAHRIAHSTGYDVAEARIVSLPVGGRAQKGVIQRMYRDDDVVSTLGNAMDNGSFVGMDDNVVRQVQEHQVLDWLIGNHDSHDQNFLLLRDGRVVGVDKGQAFKFYGTDRLAHDYKPSGNFGDIVYNTMWAEYRAGRIAVDLDAIGDALARVEAMSDDAIESMVRSYAVGRFGASADEAFLRGIKAKNADELVEAVLDRKRNIRKQFTEFYQEQAKARGVTWSPGWTDDVVRKAHVPRPPTVLKKGDVMTPITDDFAQALERVGTNGKPIYVAGTEVERGQILFDLMQRPNGERILRVNLHLRPDGDAKLMKLLRDQAGEVAYGASSVPGIPASINTAQTFSSKAISAAKTINHHINSGDFAFNQSTLKEAFDVLEVVQKNRAVSLYVKQGLTTLEAVEDAYPDAFKINLSALREVVESGADQAKITQWIDDEAARLVTAKVQMRLRPHLIEIVEQGGQGTSAQKVGIIPQIDAISEFKAIKARADEAVEQMRSGTNLITAEPEKVFDSVQLGEVSTSGVVKGGGDNPIGQFREQWVQAEAHGRYQYNISTTVNGKKVTAAYRSTDVEYPTMKGWFEIVMETGDQQVSAEDVAAIHRWLTDDIGISARMANTTDMELLYWRMVQGNYKFSKSVQESSSSAYAKAVQLAEERLGNLGANPTPEAEIDAIRGAYRQIFGRQIDDADVLPMHNHMVSQEADEFGWAYWERPELSGDEVAAAARSHPYLIHNLGYNGSSWTDEYFGAATGQGLTGQQERWRYGYNAHAASASADMRSGGSAALFSRAGSTLPYTDNALVVSSHRRSRRLLDYAASSDTYGNLDKRTYHNVLQPDRALAQAENGEWMMRDMAAFMDDGDLMFVGSSSVRQQWVEAYRRRGVYTIRGVPVEERIVYSGSVNRTEYARDFFRKYVNAAERLRRPVEIFQQGAQAVARKAGDVLTGIPSRLKFKGGKTQGGQLAKKLSTGRKQEVWYHHPWSGGARVQIRYHGVENAVSIPSEFVNEVAKEWVPKAWASTPEFQIIDLAPYELDIKAMAPYKRQHFLAAFINAIGEDLDSVNKVITQYGGVV